MPLRDKSPAALRGVPPTLPPGAARPPLNAPAATPPAQQSLPFSASRDNAVPATRPRRLWLCAYFAALPLDAIEGGEAEEPVAVFEERRGIRRVLLANRPAAREGVVPGMSVNAALALAPSLVMRPRDEAGEGRCLEALAAWADRFSSRVSVELPDLLLLEIAGSLALFGGIGPLRESVEAGLAARGMTAGIAVAPTPLAASWLARAGRGEEVADPQNLLAALAPLPLACLRWPAATREALTGMGVRSLGECLRLPREGIARRFGATCLMQLDRALGRLPDPRPSYRAPPRFCRERELPGEESDTALLREVCRELLRALEDFLRAGQRVVQRLRFSFFHLRAPATHLTLGSLRSARSVEHWCELLDIRLERLALPEPVIAIRLQSGRSEVLRTADSAVLFEAGQDNMSMDELMERLAARIGDEGVHGVTTVPDHRPHCAWSRVRATGSQVPQCAATRNEWSEREAPQVLAELRRHHGLLLRRPLWMLTEPAPLTCVDEVPCYLGPLKCLEGPERLETGWWDGNGIARDYFVAVNPKGMHVWVYRDRGKPFRWYLHGIFG